MQYCVQTTLRTFSVLPNRQEARLMADKSAISRRNTLQGMGAMGASALLGTAASSGAQSAKAEQCSEMPGRAHPALVEKVFATPLIDTHEHLIEEKERLTGTKSRRVRADDWSLLLNHYLNSDLFVGGLRSESYKRFFAAETDPADKWRLLEPYWPAVKNTGYGQAVRIAMQQLYDVDDLSAATVKEVQAGYERTRRPGFYQRVLCDAA